MVAQGAVWPDSVVVYAPLLDQDFGLPQALEDFAVEPFIPEPDVKAFAAAVFPR